jgi:NAD(P)-dependent dehydrogenase (short-subunit alcohol dehydrogenase family)/acyl carrier protein
LVQDVNRETALNQPTNAIQSNATYLITGGLGGLGLLTAEWLVQQGARHLVLLSRHQSDQTQAQVRDLEQAGVRVKVALVDVAEADQLRSVLAEVAASMPPLRGIIHAAGVLADGLLQQQNWQRMATVLSPKVMGAWNLHKLTAHQPLDFFVLFSSATALLGSPGQANHVAANTFLDTLAHYRTASALPTLSINWGVWANVGSAMSRTTQMQLKGIDSITPQQGINLFARLLQHHIAQPHLSQLAAMPMQWPQFLQQGDAATDPYFADFTTAIQTPTAAFLRELQAAPAGEQLSRLEQHVRHQIAQLLGFQPLEIDPQKGFFDLGMDSLVAVELKNRLQASLNVALPTSVLFDYPNLEELINYLEKCLGISQLEESEDLDHLSQDQLAELLAQELSNGGRN